MKKNYIGNANFSEPLKKTCENVVFFYRDNTSMVDGWAHKNAPKFLEHF